MLARIRRGVMTEDGLMKPKSVRVIEQLPNKTWIEFRLNEGKNREIRKICDAVDLTVDKLRRVAIEALNIQTLGVGKYMFTTRKELLKALGLNEHGEKISKRSFVSAKKTLNVVKMEKVLRGTSRPADDKRYQAFRKENYYETVAAIKEAKVKEAADKIIEVQETEAQARAADFARKMKHDAPKRTRGYGY
jgi:23S rRNA pseudouridine2605 synthase